jgi:hypothetical protein
VCSGELRGGLGIEFAERCGRVAWERDYRQNGPALVGI